MVNIMSEVEAFLKRSEKLLGTPSEADIKAVKDTLEALRKVSPDLIDSKIYERLSRLVDSAEIARDTQKQVNGLGFDIKNLQLKLANLTDSLESMKESFNQVDRRLTLEVDGQRSRNKKLVETLELLNQYLRRHM